MIAREGRDKVVDSETHNCRTKEREEEEEEGRGGGGEGEVSSSH
jgi:hypothetical protein